MSNITPIHGATIAGEPVSEIIATLEGLLLRAHSGEIQALAYATVDRTGRIATGWDGGSGTREPLAGAASLLSTRFNMAMIEHQTCEVCR